MKKKFKLFKFISLLFLVVFCVVLFNFKSVNATGGSQGETWVIDENPQLTVNGNYLNFTITFTSNNTVYRKLYSADYGGGYYYFFYYVDYNEGPLVYSIIPGNKGWLDEAYRTITFNTAPTGSLLTWLQANAVKVVETIPVESIEIDPPGGKMLLGSTRRIFAIVLPQNATEEVIYYSNNETVATVSEDGLITAVGVGTATITASAGGKSDTAVFTVVADTYSAGYYDGYDDGYGVGYDEGYSEAYDWVLTQVYENGISTVPKSDNTYYNNTESFDYVSGYGQAWGLGYDLGYSEGSGRPLTPEEEGIVYNWGYNAGYKAGQEDHSVGGLLKQAFGGVGQLLDNELLPNLTIGGIVIVPLLLGIVFFILKRG